MTQTFKFDLKTYDDVYLAYPNDDSATGFFFYTYEQYLENIADNRNAQGEIVDVYHIACVEGWNARFFEFLKIKQKTLKIWFEYYLKLEYNDRLKAECMMRYLKHNAESIPKHIHKLGIFKGTLEEFAKDHLKKRGFELPTHLEQYFDYDGYAQNYLSGIICYEDQGGHPYILWTAERK